MSENGCVGMVECETERCTSFEGSGRVALHLHDACTDKCIACVLQEGVAHGNQRAATPTAAMPLTLASGEEQLAEAVRESFGTEWASYHA